MNKIMFPFLITTMAGLSTLIGFLIIFLKMDKNKVLTSSLSFASGVMITVSVIDLIPEAFNYLSNVYMPVFSLLIILTSIAFGIFISGFIDKHLSSGSNSNNIYKLGLLSMIVIMLHNVPEGIVTFLTSSSNLRIGISISIAIALHNIPEGISISYPIYYATNSKKKAFLYTFIAGISEPLGAVIAYLFLGNLVSDLFMGIILSIIAGIMIQISSYEFLPTAISYKEKKYVIISFLIGSIVMIISHFI